MVSSQTASEKPDSKHEQAFQGFTKLKIFFAIVLLAIGTVFYVNNVLQVNSLLKDNQNLKKKLESMRNNNELLRAKLNELESADRIISIATTELGMVKAEKSVEILHTK